MAIIRDSAVTIYAAATTANMVMEMPTHVTGDLLVACIGKDGASAFGTPAGWTLIRSSISAGAAGGIYVKRATSASETVTFTLSADTCVGTVISVRDPEAEIDSGAGALTINVVAAGGTFTRTTGSFDTDGFQVGQTVAMSGFTNAGNNGAKQIVSITGSGTIMTVTSEATLVNESGNNDERVVSLGVGASAKTGADDATVPFTGAGLTTTIANSLLIHCRYQDTTAGTSHLPPWINIFSGDAAAGGLAAAYSFEPTASTAVTAPELWGNSADDGRSMIIEVRDGSGGLQKPPYIPLDIVPSVLISPLTGTTGVIDKGAYIAAVSIAITSVAGKTVTGVAVATTADSGYNPFRGSMRNAGASSTTGLNHVEIDMTATQDVTAGGLIFGTYLNLAPRDYVDTGKAVQGGVYFLAGSTSANWRAWVVGGQFSKTERADARNNFLIEPGISTTEYASAGTPDFASLDYMAFGSAGYFGAPSILWNELWELRTAIVAGGTTTNPFNFDALVTTVNSGCGNIPVLQQYGALATVWIPLRFGGNENIGIACDLNTFQFPRVADEIDYVDFHVSADKLGVEFYGTGSSDMLHFTNCVFTSPSSYYWRFNASHSASTNINFSGTTVVNATVTLRSTVTLDNVTFIGCGEIALNGADITDSTISDTRATTSQGAVAFTSATEGDGVDRVTFINNNDGDIGHSIRITATGTYTFDGHTFEGGGPAERSFNTTTGVDAGTDIVTVDAAHGYIDGDAIYYQDQGGAQNMGLTDGTLYYVNAQSATTLSFHTTRANAVADTSRIALTSAGGETHYIYSAKSDVYNNSGGAVTINVTNGGDVPTIRNSNGSSTSVILSVNISLTVLDESNDPIQSVQVYFQKSAVGKNWNYTSDSGNNAADADFVVNEVIDLDIPQTGWLHIWDASSNSKQNYRYASWTGKTFTLPTEVTGSATSGGTSTTLNSTGIGALNIQEGDTIRNTTDGSWATVDELSTNSATTSELTGGSDNTWQNSDNFSVHRLALAYTDGEDLVDIPIFNGQTDNNGQISTTYNYSAYSVALPVVIRVRSNQGTTKYIPYTTSGTITSTGFSGTIVLTQDTVAT